MFFLICRLPLFSSFFFFNDTATTEIYTLSLHDALPILKKAVLSAAEDLYNYPTAIVHPSFKAPLSDNMIGTGPLDRKSTRLNSSHQIISYAVFCLKKKKKKMITLLME